MEEDYRSHLSSSDVIILAGGMGKRLRKSLGGLPKPMVPVLGRPFLEWVILHLISLGFGSFVISIGYRRDMIKEHFGSGRELGASIRYVEEDSPLGTGGALKRASAAVQSADVLVLNGDSFCMCDMSDFYRLHMTCGGQATLCCVNVNDISRYGSVRIGSGHRIEAFVEKGRYSGEGCINAGIYWMKMGFLEGLDDRAPLFLEENVFPGHVDADLYAYRSYGDFIDIGTPESLGRSPAFLRSNGFLNLTQSTEGKK